MIYNHGDQAEQKNFSGTGVKDDNDNDNNNNNIKKNTA